MNVDRVTWSMVVVEHHVLLSLQFVFVDWICSQTFPGHVRELRIGGILMALAGIVREA